jgi:hypothetical protein
MRRKRRGAELPSRRGSNKEPVSNNRMEGEASELPINDKKLFDNVDPVSLQVLIGRGATKESVDNKMPEERVVVNSVDNEEPPINCALEDSLVVDSVDDEELVRDNEPVPSPVPVGRSSKVRADNDFVNDESLLTTQLGTLPTMRICQSAMLSRRGCLLTPLTMRSLSATMSLLLHLHPSAELPRRGGTMTQSTMKSLLTTRFLLLLKTTKVLLLPWRGWSSTPLSMRSSSTMNRQVRLFFCGPVPHLVTSC